jgi:SSS family solute:Na+ symporter
MKSMFGLDFSVLTISAAFALAGLAYAAFGGLRAIAISDTFNGIGLLAMGLAVTAFAMSAIDWDLSGIPAERFSLIGDADSDIPWTTLLTGMFFAHLFYWGTNMVIVQRAMAAKTVREAQKGIYAAAAFKLVIPLIVVLPGIIAYKLYGDIGDVAYGRLVGDVLPPWLSGAFAAVIAGAVLSSFKSCLNSAAALYTLDLHVRYIDPKANVRRIGQTVAVVASVVAVALVPLYQNSQSIIATLQQLNGLYSMPVLAVFLAAVFFHRPDPRAAKIALVFGAALYAWFTFGWTPLHYLHLMFITLFSALGLMWVLGRVLPPRAIAAAR